MKHGKWSVQGVPHKGWVCDNIEDLESPDAVCQMCESQPIRYVHYMSHEDYPDIFACGCDCAGHMEGSVERAEERDKSMRSSAGRRKRFPRLKSWNCSAKGNPTIEKDGMRVTIFPRRTVWKFVIHHPKIKDGKYGRKTGVSESLCMGFGPCGYHGSSVEPFGV